MQLWRIEPTNFEALHHPSIADDLALHLRYAPITTALMQIGSRQQAYISSLGCQGCPQHRCEPDCHMQLLRRSLIANRAASDLRYVPHGLMPRSYSRLVFAIPATQAKPLDAAMLRPWHDARLWASWRTVFGQRVVGVALAVGADGPDPTGVLRERDWRVCAVPTPLLPSLMRAQPVILPFGWVWKAAPQLLLPRMLKDSAHHIYNEPIVTPPPQSYESLPDLPQIPHTPLSLGGKIVGIMTIALVAEAMHNLSLALTTPVAPHISPSQSETLPRAEIRIPASEPTRRPLRSWSIPSVMQPVAMPMAYNIAKGDDAFELAATVTETIAAEIAELPTLSELLVPIAWPAGPLDLAPSEVESLLTAMLQDARLHTGRAGQIGLAVPRLRNFYGLSTEDARTILVWFDQAGILQAPKNPQQPWGMPRPFAVTDPAEIARALNKTPIPNDYDIAIAF